MLLRTVATTLVLLAGTIAVRGQALAEAPIAIDIVEYGIYTAETVTPATGINAEMKSARIRNICHVMTTLVVPAKDNLNFGFRFRVEGGTPGQIVEVKKSIRFPDHMNPPESLSTYVLNEATSRFRTGTTSYTGWTMWHTFPGTWTFALSMGDRKLAEINFTVVEKGEMRIRSDEDSTCFQSS